MKKHHVLAAMMVVGAVTLTGCANQTVRDLEGVPVTDPDKVRLVVSTDQFPNVTAMCVEGEGFVTTTRQANGVITHIPEWSATKGGWCAK